LTQNKLGADNKMEGYADNPENFFYPTVILPPPKFPGSSTVDLDFAPSMSQIKLSKIPGRGSWKTGEDELITAPPPGNTSKHWTRATNQINTIFYGGRRFRNCKQVRERWINYL
jgi:hypothetical protein